MSTKVHFAVLTIATLASLPPAAGAYEGTPQRWTPPVIASDQYEATPTFTPDGREMYFMQSDPPFDTYRLRVSRCENGAWTRPLRPSFATDDVQEGDPFVTADGKRLYFISMRHDPNPESEDFDIWYVDRDRNGGWSQPKRLPEPVNSVAAELLPRADAAGVLYFGSNRAGGHGQGDIYRALENADGTWRVNNAGPPISTAAYEYEAEISRDGRTMILLADRGDRSHLYHFESKGDQWVERGRIPAFEHVFQVGPILSPSADRLLFAQADGKRSGEFFLFDLRPNVDPAWPPRCDRRRQL